ncbi:MAG: hypothetical protein UT43_C0032G0003 [Parcubacteria group bacterium GW2011_GWC1_39_29]|uniref:Uncharacterized protein n=1 Tax=Candidatus Yanofskybacteria bacterium GW2011_GWD1_39_16 TaxID=1619030 RepID=A0A837HPQ7_9BACT|nr:MAG: hypothetical protein UT35_C0009G0003 [Candidatus Yanofskybacteria bacterium GW2011_GWD1_39_16]KKR14002.1 MAG: hypothetical protein UT43_C0032G0003 [Parcubacteria group bacterium GW2011_GWC1_39_29]
MSNETPLTFESKEQGSSKFIEIEWYNRGGGRDHVTLKIPVDWDIRALLEECKKDTDFWTKNYGLNWDEGEDNKWGVFAVWLKSRGAQEASIEKINSSTIK